MKTVALTSNSAAGVPDSTDPNLVVQKVTTQQAAPYTGQQLVTSTIAALPNVPLVNGAVVMASTTNAGTVICGPLSGLTNKNDGSGTGFPLGAGQSLPGLAITNLNQLGVILAQGNTSSTDFVIIAGN